jgi:acyl carrier protein
MLAGFYRSAAPLPEASLEMALKRNLPAYMIPARFIHREKFPLTINGKLDKKALASFIIPLAHAENEPGLQNETEKLIAATWKKILGVDFIKRSDNFFHIGGDSLTAIAFVSEIQNSTGLQMELAEVFRQPVLYLLAAHFDTLIQKDALPGITEAPGSFHLASPGQERLWMLNQFEKQEEAGIYNIAGCYMVNGVLDAEKLRCAIRHTVVRHEILRTAIEIEGNKLSQRVLEDEDTTWELHVSNCTDTNDEPAALLLARTETIAAIPFDLSQGKLFDVHVMCFRPDLFGLIFSAHHIIFDGRSATLFITEIASHYNEEATGRKNSYAPLPFQYIDYTAWSDSWIAKAGAKKLIQQSKKHFLPLPQPIDWPQSKTRPEIQTFNGAKYRWNLQPDIVSGIARVADKNGCTQVALLIAALQIQLLRTTERNDILLTIPADVRILPELENNIGFFVNTLLLRLKTDVQNQSFDGVIKAAGEELVRALDLRHLPFELLAQELNVTHDVSRPQLSEVQMLYEKSAGDLFTWEESGLRITELEIPGAFSKYDYTISFCEKENVIEAELIYNTDLFIPEWIEEWCYGFNLLLEKLLVYPETLLEKLLPETEIPIVSTPLQNDSLSALFECMIADVHEEDCVITDPAGTYSHNWVREQLGIIHSLILNVPGASYDAILVVNNNDLVSRIALLAALSAGKTVIPVTDTLDAISFANNFSQVKQVLLLGATNCSFKVQVVRAIAQYDLPGTGKVCKYEFIEGAQLLLAGINPFNYTAPLLAALTGELVNELKLEQSSRLFFSCPFASPSGIALLLAAFSLRCNVHLDINNDVSIQAKSIPDFRPTHLAIASGWLNAMQKNSFVQYAEKNFSLIVCGECPVPAILQQHFASGGNSIVWIFEPCDLPIAVSMDRITTAEYTPLNTVPLPGIAWTIKPSPQEGTHVLPELYAGATIDINIRFFSTGYHSVFRNDSGVALLGKSADIFLLAGKKVRAETLINALLVLPGIKQVHLHPVRTDGTLRQLRFFYVANREHTNEELQAALMEQIKPGQTPPRFIYLPDGEMNEYGKITGVQFDRVDDDAASSIFIGPRDEIEKSIADLWQNILGTERISVYENFFEKGGNSMKLTLLFHGLDEKYTGALKITDMFSYPTIAEQAELLKKQNVGLFAGSAKSITEIEF